MTNPAATTSTVGRLRPWTDRPSMPMTIAIAALALLLVAAPMFVSNAAEQRLVDVDGKPVTAAKDTSRIVSVGGALTEIVYALGARKTLVAVDTTSRYPASVLKTLPDVGYMRTLSAEGILSLKPTLILADEDAGPPPQIKLLRVAGVPLIRIPKDPTPRGVVRKIRIVGMALGRVDSAERLAARFERDMASLAKTIATVGKKPRVLFVLSVGRGAPLASGRKTAADGIIQLAGGVNAIQGYDNYKPLTPEGAVTATPDVILVTHRTVKLMGGTDRILARTELRTTPAGRNKRIVAMDGLHMLGFGPRTPSAVKALAKALHPGLALPRIETAEAKSAQ